MAAVDDVRNEVSFREMSRAAMQQRHAVALRNVPMPFEVEIRNRASDRSAAWLATTATACRGWATTTRLAFGLAR